jgi:hypothetical protein
VFTVANITQASANSNMADVTSGKAKCTMKAQKARQE